MERRTRTVDAGELDNAMTSYTGYINLIYGSRLKNISLYGLTDYQERLLIYTIIHDKRHFIRLVDEKLDELAQELVKEECDKIAILAKVDEIRGLLLDIFA